MKNPTLAFQAKSFFNVYLNLLNFDAHNSVSNFIVPAVVNGAFSAELALKSMLTERGIPYGREHSLLELFLLLPHDFINEFLCKFYERTSQYHDTDKWMEELILISNAFVDWRYCFEKGPLPAFHFDYFDAFIFAAFCVVSNHYDVDMVERTGSDMTAGKLDIMIEQNRADSKERIMNAFYKKRQKPSSHRE